MGPSSAVGANPPVLTALSHTRPSNPTAAMIRTASNRLPRAVRPLALRIVTPQALRNYSDNAGHAAQSKEFAQKEKAEETKYIREKEAAALKKYRERLAKQKQELAETEKNIAELEKKRA